MKGWFDFRTATDADVSLTLIVIGKHDFGPVVPERSTGKFSINVPELHPHLFAVKQGIPGLFHRNITKDAVGVVRAGINWSRRFCEFVWSDVRTGVSHCGAPVVHAGAATPASDCGGLLNDDDTGSALGGVNRRVAPGDTATDDKDIGRDFVLLAVVHRIRPGRRAFSC